MAYREQELFFYNGDGIGYENLTNYKPGGLHPIILGDVLPKAGTCMSEESRQPRYRIAQKLGSGAFSTVWLARDLTEERYVAVKVGQGSDQLVQSKEVKILGQIRENGEGKPGFENVVELYDIFAVKGPNGIHECLVMEVVVPLDNMFVQQHVSPKQLIKQLLTGFNFLHGEGLVHGDPNYANFGIAIPQLQQFDERTIANYFANPPIVPVVPRDASFPIDSVPHYITENIALGSFIIQNECFPPPEDVCLKILDFGRAHRMDEAITHLPGAAPPTVRPPEIYMYMLSEGNLGPVWSKEADIWAIGCIVSRQVHSLVLGVVKLTDQAYEMRIGIEIMLIQGNLKYQLYQALQLGGPPPEDWFRFWESKQFRRDNEGWQWPESPVFDIEEAWEARRPQDDPEGRTFLDLIRHMVTTEPTRRGQIARLLDHPYLSES